MSGGGPGRTVQVGHKLAAASVQNRTLSRPILKNGLFGSDRNVPACHDVLPSVDWVHPMIGAKIIRFLVEKAEDFFLRAKHRYEDADTAAAAGKELKAQSAEVFDLAQAKRAAAAKSEARGKDLDARADAQYDAANALRDEAVTAEIRGNELKASAGAQHEIEKIRRDNADVSEALGNELEAKAVEIGTEMQREKPKRP